MEVSSVEGSQSAPPKSAVEGSPLELQDAGISSKYLHPVPLDHDNPFLSASTSPAFDVDEFLISRAPGSTLSEITAELQEYSSELQKELHVVVDRDFKGFVNLGSALKAEGPRIARLDWKVTSFSQHHHGGRELGKQHDQGESGRNGNLTGDERSYRLDTPKGLGGNLGLDSVRSDVMSVRDDLRGAEEQVRKVLEAKEQAELQKANLTLLVTLNESLRKLEALLLPPLAETRTEYGDVVEEEESFTDERQASYWHVFRSLDTNEDSGSDSDVEETASDRKHEQRTVRPSLQNRRTSSKNNEDQRRSSGAFASRRRSSQGLNGVVQGTVAAASEDPDLPTLIARASSEYASLMFLRGRAQAIGFATFVSAHEKRYSRVRELLKDELRKIIIMLTRYEGKSMLLGDKREDDEEEEVRPDPLDLLAYQSTTLEEKKQEQKSWFESALSTWCELSPTDPGQGSSSAAEAEDTIRAALISTWANGTITSDALSSNKLPDPKTPKTPFAFGKGAYFHDVEKGANTSDSQQSFLLRSDIVDPSEDDEEQIQALIRLYNKILLFVSSKTRLLSLAAENVLVEKVQRTVAGTGEEEESKQCDIYVRVVWNEIGLRLMEQLGGQLFFAGRPEAFHRNYTVSMAFLSAFETLAPSDRSRSALRRNQTYLTFRKRWQLPVYFQIRLRNAITQLEASLSSSSGGRFGVASQVQLPLMAATSAAHTLFSSPWKKDMHIFELANRQWRLSLQILVRYRNWIEEELPSDIVLSNRRAIPETVRGQGSNGPPSRSGTPVQQDAEADDALLTNFTVVAADIVWLDEQVKASFEKEIAVHFIDRSGGLDVAESLREMIHISLAMQKRVLPLLSGRVISILKTRCAEPLRLVRSVSTQFRVHPPSHQAYSSGAQGGEASPFVSQFLRPLRQYLDKGEGAGGVGGNYKSSRVGGKAVSQYLDRNTRSQWMTEVVEDFVAKYAASLRTMNKNYESLRRLKRGNVGGATSSSGFGSLFNRGGSSSGNNATQGDSSIANSGAGGGSDDDAEAKRMHDQMSIDVECLTREVQELSVIDQTDIPTDTLAWQRLREAARGEQEEV